ncbi:MAG: hypothetical protein ACKPKO_57435, partial [Candidatus Fonsibacter sp.]
MNDSTGTRVAVVKAAHETMKWCRRMLADTPYRCTPFLVADLNSGLGLQGKTLNEALRLDGGLVGEHNLGLQRAAGEEAAAIMADFSHVRDQHLLRGGRA